MGGMAGEYHHLGETDELGIPRQKRKYILSGKYKKTYSSSELFAQKTYDPHAALSGYGGPSGPRDSSIYKREVEMDMMLPFRVRRIEKNKNNGAKK